MLKTDTRQANWRRANPGKYEAHLAVQRAVKAGELDKETCEICGVEAVDAHLDQYDEPLRYGGYAGAIIRGFIITARTCFRSGVGVTDWRVHAPLCSHDSQH